jgi:CspA family cold shock protein
VETGKIVRFDADRGYGFINPDSGGDDLFVHTNDLHFEKGLARPGTVVRFRAESGDRGAKAVDVELIEGKPARTYASGKTKSPDQIETLDEHDFLNEVTEILIDSAPTMTGEQIAAVRQALLREAIHHGWVQD